MRAPKPWAVPVGGGRFARVVYRLLVWPSLVKTRDRDKAERSPWPYRPDRDQHGPYYRLTPLGVLHRLTGVMLQFPDGFRYPARGRRP